jgi:hypothetical protein
VVGDVDLEGGDAGERAGRRPDLGGELGQGGQVVAQQRAGGGEAIARELHPVAGVAGEADDDPIDLDGSRRAFGCLGHVVPLRHPVVTWTSS